MSKDKKPGRSPEQVLEIAAQIVNHEIDKLKKLSEGENILARESAQILNDYIKSLILLQKEEREALKGLGLETKTDKELEELARQALAVLEASKENEDSESTKATDKNEREES